MPETKALKQNTNLPALSCLIELLRGGCFDLLGVTNNICNCYVPLECSILPQH